MGVGAGVPQLVKRMAPCTASRPGCVPSERAQADACCPMGCEADRHTELMPTKELHRLPTEQNG